MSLNSGKQHFPQAGLWLAQNAADSPRVFIESPRAAYYAGWRFSPRLAQNRSQLKEGLAQKKYDLVVLEVSSDEREVDSWLQNLGLHEIKRFNQAGRDCIIIAEPWVGTAQDKVSKTERIRENTGSIE